MPDEINASRQVARPSRSSRALNRIADALGVPVSTFFYQTPAEAGAHHSGAEAAALLRLVAAYLEKYDLETRRRFLAQLGAMVLPDDLPADPPKER